MALDDDRVHYHSLTLVRNRNTIQNQTGLRIEIRIEIRRLLLARTSDRLHRQPPALRRHPPGLLNDKAANLAKNLDIQPGKTFIAGCLMASESKII